MNKPRGYLQDQLPPLFQQRLAGIIPSQHWAACLQSFQYQKVLSFRINTLKISVNDLLGEFQDRKIFSFQPLWLKEAVVLENAEKVLLEIYDLIEKGYLYKQSLGSMLIGVVLNPQPGESILDVCAAPGSKTTQIAAIMNNTGRIVVIENIKKRFYKLKSVVALLGAKNIDFKLTDARKFRTSEQFDKVLVDAPCSSEGRFRLDDPKTYRYWSLRKIKEMARKQKGILLNASRFVKPGGSLVYSTCTFAPEENEAVLNWVLRKTDGIFKIVPIDAKDIQSYPALKQWQGKYFDQQVRHGFRILPNATMDGFFIAKLIRERIEGSM